MKKSNKTKAILDIQPTGEVLIKNISNEELESYFADLIIEMKVNGKKIYFANPYMFSMVVKKPDKTLLRMFENTIYCRCQTCKYYNTYEQRLDKCDRCNKRLAYNIEEYESGKFNNTDNFEDYYELGEPPEYYKQEKQETEREYEPYQKYLNSNYWKEFRQEALDYYGHKCCWCGADEDDTVFNVHHVRYGERYNEDLKNVVILCRSCHSKAHGKG